MKMRVVTLCLLVLVLCPGELINCSLQWALPGQDRRGRELSARQKEDEEGAERLQPPLAPRQRKEARWRRISVSKTSREAVGFGLRWATWRQTHSKSYSSSTESLARYVVWRSNIAYIESHNSYADNFGFTLAMNGYGDMVGGAGKLPRPDSGFANIISPCGQYGIELNI